MKYIALIPSYEPDEKIIKVLKELKNSNFEIVIVNDGSDKSYDKYFDECKNYGTLLSYDINCGKGFALKTGLRYIKDNFDDVIVVTMDSDGQHTVKDALELCKLVNDDNLIYLGKRLRGNKTPLRSKVGNSISKCFFKITTGVCVYDTQTGLRAFSSKLIPFMLNVNGDRFDYEMNVLLEATKNRIGLKEKEIETIYEDNNSGSHFKTIRDSYLIYKQVFKFCALSLISFIIDFLLYLLLNIITGNINISNIVARVVSANVNYGLNKNLVFEDSKMINKTIFKYYLLALIIIIINTILLNILVKGLFVNKYIAKIIVEVVLFIINWIIQKRYVF